MRKIPLLITAVLVLSLAFVGCSKDDTTAPKPPAQDNEAPSYDAHTVTVPSAMQTSQDRNAQMVVSYVNMVNAFTGYTGLMSPPSKAMFTASSEFSGPPWIYTWTVNQGSDNTYTVTLTIGEDTDSYTWDVRISGTFEGHDVTNFSLIVANEHKDGSAGAFTLYDPGTGQIALDLTWTHDNDGVYTFRYQVPNDTKIVVTVNPDDSGSIYVYEWDTSESDWAEVFHATWTAAGSGEWWAYDTDGTETGHGTWS